MYEWNCKIIVFKQLADLKIKLATPTYCVDFFKPDSVKITINY